MASLHDADWYRGRAQDLYHDDGVLEIDGDAEVSLNDLADDDGAYVQAWIWVSDDD
jgi:hypothetical protein